MLVYGFAYCEAKDIYTDPEPTHAVFVTEAGTLIEGTVDNATSEGLSKGDANSRDHMEYLLSKVNRACSAKSEELWDAMLSRVIIRLDGPPENTTAAVKDFLAEYNDGTGQGASSEEYLNLIDLADEVGQAVEADETVVAMNQPRTHTTYATGYSKRKIGMLDDTTVLTRARNNNLTVLLTGEPGTGKTALCEATFGDDLVTISCNEGMTVSDLVGQWMPVPSSPGDFTWKDGPLLTAMLEGRPLLLDDFSWASQTVQAALLPVLDHRRQITVVDRPEESTVRAIEGFVVVMAQNPNEGIGIAGPVRNRVAIEVHIESDLNTASYLGVDPDLLAVAYQLQQQDLDLQVQGSRGWVPSIRTLLDATRVQEVYGTVFAASTLLSDCPIQQQNFRNDLRTMLETQIGEKISDGLQSKARVDA